MSAIVPIVGPTRQLDRPATPDEQITERDAQQPDRVARTIQRLLKDVAALKSRFVPRRVDFADVVVDATGATKYRFPHQFGGRVRWWVVDWAGAAGPQLSCNTTATDNNTLVLVSYIAGTVTVRLEEAG